MNLTQQLLQTYCIVFYNSVMHSVALRKFQQKNLEVLEFLANGSYANVKLIYDAELDKKVVGKFINNKENFDNAKREANILAQFNHRNIIMVLGELNWNETYVIILEYAPFGNLETFLHFRETISISWKLRARFFTELASALNYLHNQDFIHGDLKPQNVLLGDMLVIKLADFGSVAAPGTRNGCGNTQCTPHYAAPEFLKAPTKDNKRKSMDVYSFAMIGYEIITRKIVYQGARHDLVEMAKKDRGEKPQEELIDEVEKNLKQPRDKNIFIELKNTIKQCWETDPDDRPDILEVSQQLADFAQSQRIYDRLTDLQARKIIKSIQNKTKSKKQNKKKEIRNSRKRKIQSSYNVIKRKRHWVPILAVRIRLW